MEITKEIKAKVLAQYLGHQFKSNGPKRIITLLELSSWSWDYLPFWAILKPLSSISDEDAIEVAKIICDEQYIEPFECSAKWSDTAKEGFKILMFYFKAYEVIRHIDDTPISLTLNFTNWGSVNVYVHGHLAQNNKGYFVYQFLQSKGYDLPNYHLGGKTLHESGLAIYE